MGNEKTNAIRILEKNKIEYELATYPCKEAIDGVSVAQKLGVNVQMVFKTLVTQGKSKDYYVFIIPAKEELDLKKAANAVGEKSVEMIQVKDINKVTGYIRGGCSPVGGLSPRRRGRRLPCRAGAPHCNPPQTPAGGRSPGSAA